MRSTTSHLSRFTAVMIAIVSTLALVASCSSPTNSASTSAVIWVSVDGKDSNPGTEASPFATLQRAQAAVRGRLEKGSGDVIVNIDEGIHRLTEPLHLDSRDSGRDGHTVTWRSVPGKHATLSGARSVPSSAWNVHDSTKNIWSAQVGPTDTRQLYVDGQVATRARTSDYPVGFLPHWTADGVGSGIQYVVSDQNPAEWRDPSTWSNPSGVSAVTLDQWKIMSVPVTSVTPPSGGTPGLLTMAQPAWNNANSFDSTTPGAPAIWGFWQVTHFENAYQFLDEPGEWYLDQSTGTLYYEPRPGEDMHNADVEIPVLQSLVTGDGTADHPIENLQFENLTFEGATWLAPDGPEGYVADQSGMLLTGTNEHNVVGHVQHPTPTPGNIEFSHPRNITFTGNVFRQLGAAALSLDTGSQNNVISNNLFVDTSSAAIQLAGVSLTDAHPTNPGDESASNTVTGNFIQRSGREYWDSAAVLVGFARATLIEHNTITDVPWTGIAIGWGWGLLDPSGYLGLPGATSGMWGTYTDPTPNRDSVVRDNHIDRFMQKLFDGGAIYTTGQQGPDMDHGILIEGNLATNKRADGGANTFYTDGGTRYATLRRNVSIENPIGKIEFGPTPPPGDPLPYSAIPSLADGLPYGSDFGGCRTYGDIAYESNYWLQPPMTDQFTAGNADYAKLAAYAKVEIPPLWSDQGFFDPCAYTDSNGVSHPTNLMYRDNHIVGDQLMMKAIVATAGVEHRPVSIPAASWTLPVKPN
jgi:hypothetical protein